VFPNRPIPKGFQPIAGGQRSATTGRTARGQFYPIGIAAVPLLQIPILRFDPRMLELIDWPRTAPPLSRVSIVAANPLQSVKIGAICGQTPRSEQARSKRNGSTDFTDWHRLKYSTIARFEVAGRGRWTHQTASAESSHADQYSLASLDHPGLLPTATSSPKSRAARGRGAGIGSCRIL
jgi:hypothetical protein